MSMIYQFANPDHTMIRAIYGDYVVVYDLGRDGWDEALSHDPAPYAAPPVDAETPARAKRDALLSASDWTQLADAPVDQSAWAAYRQALRDLPDIDGWADAITWPEPPK